MVVTNVGAEPDQSIRTVFPLLALASAPWFSSCLPAFFACPSFLFVIGLLLVPGAERLRL